MKFLHIQLLMLLCMGTIGAVLEILVVFLVLVVLVSVELLQGEEGCSVYGHYGVEMRFGSLFL